jgi:hypothetical protein
MQLSSISASATMASAHDGYCGTKVPGLPHPHPDPDPFAKLSGLLEKMGLNPQPLPPKEIAGAALGAASKFADEFCGTVPRGPFPPLPPHIGGLLR